jgi:hypothetical protein
VVKQTNKQKNKKYVTKTISVSQSQKYFLSGPSQKTFSHHLLKLEFSDCLLQKHTTGTAELLGCKERQC